MIYLGDNLWISEDALESIKNWNVGEISKTRFNKSAPSFEELMEIVKKHIHPVTTFNEIKRKTLAEKNIGV